MRIVIDCFKLVKGAGKSIGIYNVAQGLVQNLAAEQRRSSDPRIKNSELIVLGNAVNRPDFEAPGVRFVQVDKYDPANKIHCVLWELFAVSRELKKLRADAVVFPRGFCALTHPVKDFIIIHDLIPFYYNEHFPRVFNRLENAYIMNRLRASARTCARIITISDASRRDILKYCGVDDGKITVIQNACGDSAVAPGSAAMPEPYVSAMTSGLPHKNAGGVLAAYREYCARCENPLPLALIGLADTSGYDLPEDVRKRITCYKFVKDTAQLNGIIGGSRAFLFLSLIEGFGLPPIEAMQLGVPVVCSNTSSLPEVVGDSALLVDPTDAVAAAEQLRRAVEDEPLREKLIRGGYENVGRFTWESRSKLYWSALLDDRGTAAKV